MKQRFRRRFRLLAVAQVLALAATLTAFAFTILRTGHVAIPILLGTVVVLQIVALLHTVQRHVDALGEFFAAVTYEDFTRRFVEDDVDVELKDAFNTVLERFQDARADRDLQASYLDTVIRHVPVPLIAAGQDGRLTLVNNPARRLIGRSTLTNIRDLADLGPALPGLLASIAPGRQRMIEVKLRGVPAELRVSVAELRMKGAVERIYSMENLSGELSARESSAWRNLIRVLTHEIMNTLTPVTSLAHTTVDLLDDPAATDDIREAIATIGRRSDGLMNFVSRYRELLKVPEPGFQQVAVQKLLDNVCVLMKPTLENIDLTVDVTPDSLTVSADSQLLEQVLINLLRNAADALNDCPQPEIKIVAGLDLGRTIIQVTDNGTGIDEDDLDQVFIPFFTTKRDGSGIGLSLCRQIMTAHGGELALSSDGSGTTVKMVFN